MSLSQLLLLSSDNLTADELLDRLTRATKQIAVSSHTYTKERDCFSCHHQSLPVYALRMASHVGIEVDESVYQIQDEHTDRFFWDRREELEKGKGVPGGPFTAGYALVQYAVSPYQDPKSIEPLLTYLNKSITVDHWTIRTMRRPPMEGSHFTATALAVAGMRLYQARLDTSPDLTVVEDWLVGAEPQTTEDLAYHLFALYWLQIQTSDELFATRGRLERSKDVSDAIERTIHVLLQNQRSDGGWNQTPLDKNSTLESDAYSTGQVLTALRVVGRLSNRHTAVERAKGFLLDNQLEDGTWHVSSRANAFQEYFESGFPHAKDQFISISATCWGVIALSTTMKIRP
ncbi:MAG: hypothetical protein ACJZ8O_12750 [Pirellulaceae bacterium]